MASQPSSANCAQFSGSQPFSVAAILRRFSKVYLSRTKRSAGFLQLLLLVGQGQIHLLPPASVTPSEAGGLLFAATGRGPSTPLRSRGAHRDDGMFIAQDDLGNDVLLNLGAAAVDRRLAHVEIARRRGRRMVGTDRRLVGVVEQHAGLVRRGVLADRLHRQLGDALLDLRAAHLEGRDLGAGRAAQRHGRQRAQLAHLERLHLQVDVGDLLVERGIVVQLAQGCARRAWKPAPRRCRAARWRAGTWRRSSPRSPCRCGWRPAP